MDIIKNDFCELTTDEMNEIDGGAKFRWGLCLACPPFGFHLALIAWDLENCFENGYAEGRAL